MLKPNDQMQTVLDAHKDMGPLPIESLSPEHARQIPLLDRAAVAVYGHHITKKALAPFPLGVGKIENRQIPGPGGDILARFYTPKGDAPKEGWPVLVYFHGGGWVIATLDTYDATCRGLCDGADCIVVSVHYRQAPEHPWPAAKDDAIAAYQWVCMHAKSFHGNPRAIAVAGESAGGNLAAVVAQTALRTSTPLPVHQVLIYPVTDIANGATSASAMENADAQPLNTAMMHWFYNHYLPAGTDRTDPEISPLYADDLAGIPCATIILADIDPLRSDGEAYADKLRDAGATVDMEIYEGVTHEFFGLTGLVSEANKALAKVSKNLREAFKHGHQATHKKAA